MLHSEDLHGDAAEDAHVQGKSVVAFQFRGDGDLGGLDAYLAKTLHGDDGDGEAVDLPFGTLKSENKFDF